MKKEYWFYMEPYVHIAVRNGNAMVYNTLNGKVIEEKDPDIVKLVRKMNAKKNLLVIKLSEDDLTTHALSAFVKKVREHYSGDLIDVSCSLGKPIQIRPQVKIHKDVEKNKERGESDTGEGVMNNLSEISLYINNLCDQNCSFCRNAFKQFLMCTRHGMCNTEELELESIKIFLEEVQGSSVHRINILGGDIFSYSNFEKLCQFLNNYGKFKTYHSHYLNLHNRENELKQINHHISSFVITAGLPLEEDKFKDVVDMFNGLGIDREFVFIIQKEEEIGDAEESCNRLKITNFTFKPFYNGENFSFFQDHVFVDKQILLQQKPDSKQIYSRMKTNPLNFGKMTVLSNGAIHANVNDNKIGIFVRDSVYDIALKELYEGRSWRKSRDKVSPCKSCVYCFICPPLTNYEYAIRRNNLCHIWKK